MISLGKRWVEGGFEYAELVVGSSKLVKEWLDKTEDFPHTIAYNLRGWYLNEGKPKTEDIVDAQIRAQGAGYIITIKIRRGWELLNEFMSRHALLTVTFNENEVSAYCECLPEDCDGGPRSIHIPLEALGAIGGDPSVIRKAVAAHSGEATSNSS